jgi:hypothetical protein
MEHDMYALTIVGVLALAASQSDPRALERIERLMLEADAAETRGEASEFQRRKKADLDRAARDLAACLESSPNDPRALLLSVRLGRFREVMRPQVVTRLATDKPNEGIAALVAIVDRVLASQPDNPEAHYWKSRLCGIKVGADKGGTFVRLHFDLPQAVASAQRAVDLAPSETRYREALAQYLLDSGEPERALEALRNVLDGDGKPHVVAALLSQWQTFKVPGGAIEQPSMAEPLSEMMAGSGALRDHPSLRLRIYTVPSSAAVIEGFYRQQWKGFTLFEGEREDQNGAQVTTFGQLLRWSSGRLEPATSKKDVDKSPESAEGLWFMLTEFKGLPQENRKKLTTVTADPFTQLVVINTIGQKPPPR